MKKLTSICHDTWSVSVKVRGENVVEKQVEGVEELIKVMMAITLRLSIKTMSAAAEDEFHKVNVGIKVMEKAIEENLHERSCRS